MEDMYNKHHIRLAGENHPLTKDASAIVHGFSDAFEPPLEGDILINDKGGHQFRLSPDGEENPQLRDDHGVPMYAYTDGNVVERSPADIWADRPEPAPPSTDPVREFVAGMMGELKKAGGDAPAYAGISTFNEISAMGGVEAVKSPDFIAGERFVRDALGR